MLLNFEELDKLKFELVDLGRAVSDLSSSNEDYFKVVQGNTERLKDSLGSILNTDDLAKSLEATTAISKKVDEFAATISTLSGMYLDLDTFQDDLSKTSDKFSSFANTLDQYSKGSKDSTFVKTASWVSRESKKSKPKKRSGVVSRVLGREAKGARGALGGIARKLKLPSSAVGKIAATGIAWMAFGFSETQRLEALAGKAKNILVSAVDGANKAAVDKSKKWLTSFTESMNKFYGISEQETLALAQSFANMGFSVEEALNKKVGPSIAGFSGNYMTLSLELDKMFELSTGTMAKKMGDYAHRYGMSLKESAEALTTMLAAGRGDDNIGSLTFLNHIERSMDALDSMGYKITEVVGSFESLRKTFEGMGVPKFYAAKEAAAGIQGIAQGMGSMNMDWQVFSAEALGYGQGLEGRMKLMDAMSRIAEMDPDKFATEIVALTRAIYQKLGSDEIRTRVVLEKGTKFGISGARSAMELMKASDAGDTLSMDKLKKEKLPAFQKELAGSLDTERQKITKMQIFFNEWLVGMRHVGQGLLGLTADTLFQLIAFFKSIPAFFESFFSKDYKTGEAYRRGLMEQIQAFGNLAPKHIKLVTKGFSELGSAGKHMGAEVVGDLANNMVQVHEYNPYAVVAKYLDEQKPKSVPSSKGRVQVVTIPVAKGDVTPSVFSDGANALATGRFPLDSDAYRPKRSFLESLGDAWSGEDEWYGTGNDLQIVSHGVTDRGDIQLSLQGHCPRCGLEFGTEEVGESEQPVSMGDKDATTSVTADSTPGKAGTVASKRKGRRPSTFDYSSPHMSEKTKRALESSPDSNDDLEVLTRMLFSEGAANKVYKPGGEEELAGIAYTALNRLGGGHKGKTLRDVITSGHGYGVQGGKRQYATARVPGSAAEHQEYSDVREFAKKILSGEVRNPVGKATSFLHNTGGAGYLGGTRHLPRFGTDPKNANTANINSARFYGRRSAGATDAPDRAVRDANYLKRYEEKQGSSSVE